MYIGSKANSRLFGRWNLHASHPLLSISLNILITDVFRLASKFGEFGHTLHALNVDIAIVTETKLTLDKMTMAESTIKGFHSPLRLDRTAHGGGVACVWVRDDLAFQHLTTIDCGQHELIWLSIKLSSREKLVIGAVYIVCVSSRLCLGPRHLIIRASRR